MAQMPKAEITAELIELKPPRYQWKCIECFGAELHEELNRIDADEWDIFQVIPSQRSGVSYVVIARKSIEDAGLESEESAFGSRPSL